MESAEGAKRGSSGKETDWPDPSDPTERRNYE
jgi:hypothetical protein